jgi:hypothetical protein
VEEEDKDNHFLLLVLVVDQQQQEEEEDLQVYEVFSIVDQGLNNTKNCLINQSIHKPLVSQKYTSHPLHPQNLLLKTQLPRKFAPPQLPA